MKNAKRLLALLLSIVMLLSFVGCDIDSSGYGEGSTIESSSSITVIRLTIQVILLIRAMEQAPLLQRKAHRLKHQRLRLHRNPIILLWAQERQKLLTRLLFRHFQERRGLLLIIINQTLVHQNWQQRDMKSIRVLIALGVVVWLSLHVGKKLCPELMKNEEVSVV